MQTDFNPLLKPEQLVSLLSVCKETDLYWYQTTSLGCLGDKTITDTWRVFLCLHHLFSSNLTPFKINPPRGQIKSCDVTSFLVCLWGDGQNAKDAVPVFVSVGWKKTILFMSVMHLHFIYINLGIGCFHPSESAKQNIFTCFCPVWREHFKDEMLILFKVLCLFQSYFLWEICTSVTFLFCVYFPSPWKASECAVARVCLSISKIWIVFSFFLIKVKWSQVMNCI